MREICVGNALFVFIVKAVLIFLSIIGYCNPWLAVVIDFAAAVASVLNTIRVTSESLRSNLRYKMGRRYKIYVLGTCRLKPKHLIGEPGHSQAPGRYAVSMWANAGNTPVLAIDTAQ
jgi:hypothetical protein